MRNTFCYGYYLGPSQIARAMKDTDRRQVAYINQYHFTEQNLLDTNVEVINAYNCGYYQDLRTFIPASVLGPIPNWND